MDRRMCLLVSLFFVIIVIDGSEHEHKGTKLLICPCNANKLCAESSNGYAICNCWTHCGQECPYGFDRIDETTEFCTYTSGLTRNQCSTQIECDDTNKNKKKKHKHKESKSKDNKKTTPISNKSPSALR